MPIELRSDTFTKPSEAMLNTMRNAEVGDDVFEEDPTTIALEKKCAHLLGYEAGLFCLSGTMANQIAIAVHCTAGDEVICDALSHIYLYEGGGIMSNARASVHLLQGDRGRINAEQISDAIKPNNVHYPVSKLVSLENTVNKGGGAIYDIQTIKNIKTVCDAHGMKLHLDGARLFNAIVETGEMPTAYGALFDTMTICLSKGLGAPMGTVLLGTNSFIKQARRVRKRLGGGWRQSGYIAAAGIYALDNNIPLLKHDHRRAKQLGELFLKRPEVKDHLPIDTNIVILNLNHNFLSDVVVEQWNRLGIKTSSFGKHQIRLVTHLDFTDSDLMKCEELLKQ